MKSLVALLAFVYSAPLIIGADVNLLWINDQENGVAKEAIEVALEQPAEGVNIANKEMIDAENGIEVVNAIEQLCTKLEAMIDAGSPPDIIIDSTRSGVMSDVVKTMTWTLGLPTLSTSYGETDEIREWRDLSPQQQNYLIQIRPPGDVITGVVRELIERQNITNAAILYDDTFVMDYKYKNLLLNIPTRHIIHMVKDQPAELRQQLRDLAKVDLNNFFVLGSTETISKVFSSGNNLKLIGAKYAWFGLTKDTDTSLTCNGCNHDKMFMMPLSSMNKVPNLRRNYGVEGVPDVDIAFYYDTLHLALKAVSSMKDGGIWPALEYQKCNEYNGQDPIVRNVNLMQSLTSESANYAFNFAPLRLASNGESSMIFDVAVHQIKYRAGSISAKENVGTWSLEDPDNFKLSTGMTLSGLSAKTMYKVVTVLQPPFMMKEIDADGKTIYKGYCVDLLNALSELMHFDYEIYESPDGKYGQMSPDKSWNGVIRELIETNADIAIGALSVMAERETVIDFTVPYYDLVGITIMMKKPKVPTSLFKFLTVLENTVWGCILAAYFFTSFLMWVFDKFSPYSYQNNVEKYKDDEEKRYFNFKECLWFCMTSLTPQGGGEAPKNLSGRLVAATWWLFGFIIIASYTANLAAFLTVSRLETPVESLEDLSKQYKIQYSPLNGSAAMVYFERMAYIEEKFYQIWKDMSLNDSTDDYERSKLAVWDYPVSDKYTKMWQSMQEAGLPTGLDEAKQRVRDSTSSSEGYAFIGDATDIRYQVLTNCDLQMVGEEFSRKPYALAVQQGSPLKDQLNDAILKLLNQRKLETFKERWWNQNPDKKVCEDEGDDTAGGISIYNIGGVFIVIFVGIALAVVTLIVEYWYYKYKKPSSRISTGSDKFAKQLKVKAMAANNGSNTGVSGLGAEKTEYGLTFRGHDHASESIPTIAR